MIPTSNRGYLKSRLSMAGEKSGSIKKTANKSTVFFGTLIFYAKLNYKS